MTARRLAAALAGLAAVVLLASCRTPTPPAPAGVRTSTPGGEAPAFSSMRQVLLSLAPAREREDAAALRARGLAVTARGLELLRARMPHDLRRAHVAHFLEGRAAFGDALKVWAGGVEGGDDPAVLGAYDGLVEAYWAWVDAYRGLPPERAV